MQRAGNTEPTSHSLSAISHYADLLSDFYDHWITPLRDEYRDLYLNALLALIGAGGAGITRLSIELGRAFVGAYSAGMWWEDLSSLADSARVPDAVAKSLGAQERPK